MVEMVELYIRAIHTLDLYIRPIQGACWKWDFMLNEVLFNSVGVALVRSGGLRPPAPPVVQTVAGDVFFYYLFNRDPT